jgi:hypothetical protein
MSSGWNCSAAVFVLPSFCISPLRIMCALSIRDVSTFPDFRYRDRSNHGWPAGLWPNFGQLVAMQVRAWLVARPLARLLLMQLSLALAAVLLIGVS